MTVVYSTKFAAGAQASGSTSVVYTVPAGYVAVVRDIEVGAQNAPANSVAINLAGVAEIYQAGGIAQYSTAQWKGRVVLNAGDQINVDAIAGTWTYIISGYLLTI